MMNDTDNILDRVFTAAGAAQKWGLGLSTVKRACQDSRIECKKDAGTWIVTKEGMIKLYGDPKNNPLI